MIRLHDPLCNIVDGPCCPWMGDCDCQCTCGWIAKIREDEDRQILETLSKMRGRHRIKLINSLKRRERYLNEAIDWVMQFLVVTVQTRKADHEVRSTEGL
jgi:hypothetical protein